MIISWMVYLAAVGLLLAGAAWLVEGPLRRLGIPGRMVWMAVLMGSLLLPAAVRTLSTLGGPDTLEGPQTGVEAAAPEAPPGPAGSGGPQAIGFVEWVYQGEPLTALTAPARELGSDSWMLVLWAIASGGIALVLVVAYAVLLRRRRTWAVRPLDGRLVRVSASTGPAVIGFLRSEIVIPRWLLEASAEERELALAHEEEHIRAGDVRLLLAALVAWVAMPWNPAAWWVLRSLRRAVEIDCDERMLARGADPRAYARLLMRVMSQGSTRPLLVAALPESPSFLERRVKLMLVRERFSTPRAIAATLLAAGLLAAACAADQPIEPPVIAAVVAESDDLAAQPEPVDALAADSGNATSDLDEEPGSANDEEAETAVTAPAHEPRQAVDPAAHDADPARAMKVAILERYHPEVLSEALPGPHVALYFVADARGEIVRSAVEAGTQRPECGGVASRLGPFDGRPYGGGCGRLGRVGPNDVAASYVILGPEPGEDDLPPTGPFTFYQQMAEASRARERQRGPAIARHHPDVLDAGLPYGETLWFIADEAGQVLETGRGWRWSSSATARRELQERFPHLNVGVTGMGSHDIGGGQWVSVLWATHAGGGAASAPARSPDPTAHVRHFTVTTAVPGSEVRVRLSGADVGDPNAFRIDGRFRREGNGLVATTPFTFVAVTPASFSAAFDAGGEDLHFTGEIQGERIHGSGNEGVIRRMAAGGEVELAAVRR
jgi:hypothetical protein